MYLEIYNMVKEVIGGVPVEMEFIYSIGTIFVFCMIIYCVFVLPVKILYGN